MIILRWPLTPILLIMVCFWQHGIDKPDRFTPLISFLHPDEPTHTPHQSKKQKQTKKLFPNPHLHESDTSILTGTDNILSSLFIRLDWSKIKDWTSLLLKMFWWRFLAADAGQAFYHWSPSSIIHQQFINLLLPAFPKLDSPVIDLGPVHWQSRGVEASKTPRLQL